jgi:hypothetical protein
MYDIFYLFNLILFTFMYKDLLLLFCYRYPGNVKLHDFTANASTALSTSHM